MTTTLTPAQPEHHESLARICHLAFNTLHERHRIHRDVPEVEVGKLIIGGVLFRPDYLGVVATREGRIIGSNFLCIADEVCGIGPITVDPTVQAQGTGRMLMQWAIDQARALRGPDARVRLFQEAVNTTSLSLYASLGFRWQYAAALMMPTPAPIGSGTVRAMLPSDLPTVGELSQRHHGHSRLNDATQLLATKFPAWVLERGGRVVAYQISTLFGHAAAENQADLLGLVQHVAAPVPPPMSVVIVPMNQHALFTSALAARFKTLKVLNYMSLDDITPAAGPSMPSIQS